VPALAETSYNCDNNHQQEEARQNPAFNQIFEPQRLFTTFT
jgi:hypothetical protein